MPDTTTAVAARSRANLRQPPDGAHELRRSPTSDRFPGWLRALDATHRATGSPVAMGADLGVVAACGLGVGAAPVVAVALAAGFVAGLYLSGKYTDRSPLETQGLLWYASQTLVAVAIATLLGVTVAHAAGLDVGPALRFGGAAAGGLIFLRAITWMILAVVRRRGAGLCRTLIVGDSAHARMLARKLSECPEAGLLPVAMLPLGNGHGFARFLPEFPSAAQLARTIEESSVEHVVLAPDGSDEAILECVRGSEGLDVSFSILPPLSEFFLHPGHVAQVGGLPLISLGKIARRRTALPGKRLFDLVVGSILLVVLCPIFMATAVALRVLDRGPIFYRQRRVGRNGKVFEMRKFRSMVVDAERLVIDLRDQNVNNGLLFKLLDDPRITRVGRIIRRLSIDELPQLWNVIRGEMSLVGPRPLPVSPDDFGPIDNKRHTVPPGITGYWQIAGAHGLTYEEMIKLDLAYIENWSPWLDVRLLLRTVPALVHRRGPW